MIHCKKPVSLALCFLPSISSWLFIKRRNGSPIVKFVERSTLKFGQYTLICYRLSTSKNGLQEIADSERRLKFFNEADKLNESFRVLLQLFFDHYRKLVFA